MKKWKKGLKRLTAIALAVMMVGTTTDFSAFAVSAAEGVSIECICETDDLAFHATNCPAYITPENPQCTCVEKCTDDTLNVWCDVCGVQGVSACQGEETAVAYEILASGNCGAQGNESSITWSLDSDGTLTISGSGAMADYELVEGYYTTPWHDTDNDGRYQNSNINKVVVEEGVTHIGNSAFKDFTELTSISIPNTVKSIGNDSVSYCYKLTSLVIPDSVTSIGEHAFYENITLTSVTIGDSVETIGKKAFYGMGRTADTDFTITLPKSVTYIAPDAFMVVYRGATIRYSCSYNDGNGYSTGNNTFLATLEQYHLCEYSSSGNKINCSGCTCGEYSSSTATLSLSSDEPIYYTGEEIKPAVTVTYPDGWGGDKIEPNESNCTYSDNINAGAATCTFKYAEGVEASLDFTIAECPHWGVDSDGMCDNCDYLDEPECEDEYYQIANAGNLMWFAQQVNEGRTAINAKLTADIDMKDIDWTTMSSFAGTFDGDGHTILYLCADENGGDDDIADGSRCGLFQTLAEGGTVTNLTISGAQLWSAHSAGAIAAVNNGTISKCIVKDSSIMLGQSHGLAAIAGTNTGTVTDCGAVNCFLQRRYGAVNSSTYAIGAVVEDNSGTVSNCFSYGCTFSNSPNLYAIVESGNAPVNCYYYTDATVSDTVVTAKTADQFAGGEVAYLLNGDQTTIVWGQTLTGENAQVYPVLNGDKVYRYESVKCDSSSKDPAVYGYSNEEKSDVIDEHNVDSNGFCTACGAYEKPETDENGVYQISNAGELYWFADKVNNDNANYGSANAKLTADIVVNSDENISSYNGTDSVSWRPWTPIGNNSNNYTGTFDGNNKTVSGLYFNNTSQNYVGLFGYLVDGEIKNVGVVNSYFNGNSYVGGVCGRNYGTITNCYNTGTVVGAYYVGGVCSYNSGGTIKNCYNTGCVSGTSNYVGGVCGYNSGGTIENCYNTGCVSGTYGCVGGVCGYNYVGPIKNCYYDNTVYTGNAVSSNYNGTLTSVEGKSTDQFASGEVTYLLNGSSSENVTWYQKLLTDTYPVLDREQREHGTVYSVLKCDEETQVYRNINENEPHTDVNPVDNVCDVCNANLHTHEWTYTANEDTITAVCGADDCPLDGAKTIVIFASDKTYDGTAVVATVENNVDTTDYSSLIVYRDNDGDVVDEAVNAGTYTANLTVGGKTATVEFKIDKVTPDIGTVSASNMENTLDVSQVVLSRSNETVPGTLSLAEGTTLQYGIHDYTYVFTPNDNTNYETVTGTVSITITDTNAPTATYKVGTDGWKQFINTITFGHFCKDYTTVDITYSDEGSGVADKQYYISNEEIINAENIQWSKYTDTLNINATGKYYIYVKVTDKGGNKVIRNSEGIVVYAESVITPTSFAFEYGEENDLSVNITTNGNTFANLTDGSGNEIAMENYSIDGSTLTIKGEYLSDLDVGEYTYKICMNPQGVENTEVTLAYSFIVPSR